MLEEFLFIDRGNRDIGDLAYLDIQKLIDLEAPENANIDLYSICNILIGDGQNYDMRPMPGYINFYGSKLKNSKKSFSHKTHILAFIPSKSRNNLHKTFTGYS